LRSDDLTENVVEHLARVPDRPQYVKVTQPAGSSSPGMTRGGPRLGIIPDYGDTAEGLLLSGVSDNGPAAKAGLREGDRIIELAGKSVNNINTYMVLMAAQKKGETIEVGIMRGGKKVRLKVVLE